MAAYREYRFWSPLMGIEACRLSTVGGTQAARFHGSQAATSEYFAIIPADVNGKAYRERRSLALDAIDEAIATGSPPGEVVVECAG